MNATKSLLALLLLLAATGCDCAVVACDGSGQGTYDDVDDDDDDEPTNPSGEYGFTTTVTGAVAYEGKALLVAVKKYEVAWCASSTIEDGAASLGTNSDILADGYQYVVRWWIDANGDGQFGGDNAGWSQTFEAVQGTSAVSLDASQPGTSTLDASAYDCP